MGNAYIIEFSCKVGVFVLLGFENKFDRGPS